MREIWSYFKQPPAIKKIATLTTLATQLEHEISIKQANLDDLEEKVAVCAHALKQYCDEYEKLSKNSSDDSSKKLIDSLQRKITKLKTYFEENKPYDCINKEKTEISTLKLDLQKLQDIITILNETSVNLQKEEYIPLINSYSAPT